MSKTYDPVDWYWIVAGDQTKAFSSASGDYVPAAGQAFTAFKEDGTLPTIIDTEVNLGAVLAQAGIRPVHAGILDGYKSAQASEVLLFKVFKILFQHENRIRALERAAGLNGSPPNLTAQQAFALIKSLM